MCGIAGFIGAQAVEAATLDRAVRQMVATLTHRGPDDEGTWVDPTAGAALGVRRLAIIDRSPSGHQPMSSASGRYVIVFNGEIYNHRALRDELVRLGCRFRGTSDTEVLLAAISQWSVETALQRSTGMFGLALWDRRDRALYLARDRMGEKPLYYGWMGKTLLFGSELKALRAHEAFEAQVDRDALALFLRHNHVPAPHSIYRGVFKLPPATFLRVNLEDLGTRPQPVAYWSLAGVAERGAKRPREVPAGAAVDELERLLLDATRLQMVADVPVGAFLSGGVDSSTIVALMQTVAARPVKTFSIGSQDARFNEAGAAAAVARHLKTEHTELIVTPADAMAVIPRLPSLYDEPFADSSQIPTYLVAHLARQQVTVSLSGDGGDEIFGGYTRHVLGRQLWDRVRWMPYPIRAAASRLLDAPSPRAWDDLALLLQRIAPRSTRSSPWGSRMQKLASLMRSSSPADLYLGLVSQWTDPLSIVRGAADVSAGRNGGPGPGPAGLTEQMMYLDAVTYLPDDILVKVDRATMGVSLESRAPYLDPRVVEFAWSLPMSMKIRDGRGKWLLRQVLDRHVPRALVERPKSGFAVPIDGWMRGPLRDWVETLLDEPRLRAEGFFDPGPIRRRWSEHLSGKRNWQGSLWCILMFETWLESIQRPLTVSLRS